MVSITENETAKYEHEPKSSDSPPNRESLLYLCFYINRKKHTHVNGEAEPIWRSEAFA